MRQRMRSWIFLSMLVLVGISLFGFSVTRGQAEGGLRGAALAGSVFDHQGQPVQGATGIALFVERPERAVGGHRRDQ